ncbi:hypothetical protein C8J56DRAFT_860214 [Mycena floridula]|nr:hypothetical protein C8J56DRAFT_860214 [Mycena floridula]
MLLCNSDTEPLPLYPPSDNEYRGTAKREPQEFIWANLQPFLKKAGYELCPRFHPEWKPSWLRGAFAISQRFWAALDAIRIKDGKKVVLKITYSNSDEARVSSFFSSFPDEPRNHCVPIFEILSLPDERLQIIVMPFLMCCTSPLMHCMVEVIESLCARCWRYGLVFMHEQDIPHRDISSLNIMMDGTNVFPSGCHFSSSLHYTLDSGLLVPANLTQNRCSVAPVRYFYIDFGFSHQYLDGPERTWILGKEGQLRTPELSNDVPYNPFRADIFQLGTTFKGMILLTFLALDDFHQLLDRMTATLPEDRPTAPEALLLFEDIVSSMSSLRLEVILQKKPWVPEKRPNRFRLFAQRHLSLISRFLFSR